MAGKDLELAGAAIELGGESDYRGRFFAIITKELVLEQ